MWDTNYYQVTHSRTTAQSIHCMINNTTGTVSCFSTIIYAFNTNEKRKELWTELAQIEQGVDRPWIIARDFNVVLYPNDRLYGAPVSSAETQDFTKCLHDLHLNELPWKGDYYTWSNKQMGTNKICSRIDRMFGNPDWMMHWGHVVTQYEVPYISDHSPLLIKTEDNQWTVKTLFRFFNIWADHSKFMEKVTEVWHKQLEPRKMSNIWAKLRALKKILKILNKDEFQNSSTRITEARLELIQTQEKINQQYTDELLSKERQALMNIEKWKLVEESALRQKSRAKWIKLGDSNNKYFSAMIKERTNKKMML
ncbi:uncharacterized protein LOC129894813 [Solanum dulcamara]|uniref:uncharacterized protein LOC129894813 n=1 Tax=Solanum dulcamara TaxID=45834 RepID=UPI0024850EBC|nr:uncharacterized protein LOC129894813 [Solanum dulcamara]